ncbi:hypothetical protein FA10DRAFT_267937 [Acaromyces ingoldii]|uniref:Exosome complex protein n=1 Tax=Acaromyces ingoldii TaxID=215250 RepID=A0A316YL41_9BASI|nr:hypothetical protein FA10DRAFT_267937 [Acaromyces ingoldii]PWN89368.1 hypothetical protein FA10DRAFT_267937 [Acaromyces ingoldii]
MASSSSLRSPAPTVAQLRTLLDSLHASLNPVISSELSQLTSQLESRTSADASVSVSSTGSSGHKGKLDAGRLQTSLAYVLLDLVWILFKLNGTDASKHPVLVELERVKGYFTKFQAAEKDQGGSSSSSTREGGHNRAVSREDQDKVERFVTHALGKGKGEIMGRLIRFDDDGEEEDKKADGAEEDRKKKQEWESIKESASQGQGTKRKVSGGTKAPSEEKIKKKKSANLEQGIEPIKRKKERKSSGSSAR